MRMNESTGICIIFRSFPKGVTIKSNIPHVDHSPNASTMVAMKVLHQVWRFSSRMWHRLTWIIKLSFGGTCWLLLWGISALKMEAADPTETMVMASHPTFTANFIDFVAKKIVSHFTKFLSHKQIDYKIQSVFWFVHKYKTRIVRQAMEHRIGVRSFYLPTSITWERPSQRLNSAGVLTQAVSKLCSHAKYS
jgi:hypothetical protein